MRMTPSRAVLLLVATLLAVAAGLRASAPGEQSTNATPQAPSGQQKLATGEPPAQVPEGGRPVFRTGINFIRVDAIVSDGKGNPVTDLKIEDFDISEDGKPQKPETLRLIKIDATTAPSYTQRTIRTRLDEETAAADETSRIFVFFLDDYAVRRENSMAVRKPLIDFITRELAPNDLISVMYPLTPIDAVTLTRNHQGVINTIEKFEGRKYNYDPINELERQYVYKLTPDAIERLRRQVSLGAIRGIVTKLGSLREGRKSLIMVSEGYSATLPPQMRSDQPGGYGDPGRATRDPFAGDNNLMEDRVQFTAGVDLLSELQDVFNAANRNNTSLYPVDPRRLTSGEFDITANISGTTSQTYLATSTDSLRTLAENTDGRAIVNQNDLGPGLKQIVRDASAYYLIGYTSSQAPMDGKFHAIRVRVKRPGVQVRARKGYWAYTEADAKRAEAGPRPGPPTAVSRALATITTPAGDIDYRGRLPATLAPTGQGAAISFDAKPGKLDLRLTIEGDGTGTLDTEDRELMVPDLAVPELLLGTPKLWFARSAREFAALAAGADVPPTATREFRRTDRLLIRVEAFGPGTEPPTVTARLLNQQGDKMGDITVTPPLTPGGAYTVDLPLANYATGQFLLELSADGEGHKPVSELVAFRIGT